MFVKNKNKQKEAGVGPFRKRPKRICHWCSFPFSYDALKIHWPQDDATPSKDGDQHNVRPPVHSSVNPHCLTQIRGTRLASISGYKMSMFYQIKYHSIHTFVLTPFPNSLWLNLRLFWDFLGAIWGSRNKSNWRHDVGPRKFDSTILIEIVEMLKNEKNDAARFSANIEQGWVHEFKIETTFSISLSLSFSISLSISFSLYCSLKLKKRASVAHRWRQLK